MGYAADRIRDARSAMAEGKHRRVVQLCEQVRANERLTEAQMVEVFGLLGRAHVALGEHETALTFLKRADRSAETLEAARVVYRELALEGDASAVFEQGDLRRKRRMRERLVWVLAAIVAAPFVIGCGLCVFSSWVFTPLAYLWAGPDIERMEAAREAGLAAGRGGTIATCEAMMLGQLAECSGASSLEDDACLQFWPSYGACLSVASGWDAYCASVPPPIPRRAAHAWAEARCTEQAFALGLDGDRAELFGLQCAAQLGMMPEYCADPEVRPRDVDSDPYETWDDYE